MSFEEKVFDRVKELFESAPTKDELLNALWRDWNRECQLQAELRGKIQYLLDNFVATPEGRFTFPDGDTWTAQADEQTPVAWLIEYQTSDGNWYFNGLYSTDPRPLNSGVIGSKETRVVPLYRRSHPSP